ncbi:MAG TPA: glutamate racemase, partial [Candidatus Limnocylindrales bacterium]|nr:glutamate racemase [Candidatus Limnocylindrales bacterium]
MTDPRPIGVFDSGVGGLTVLREILRRTPDESTIYFGDNARAPYGVRPDSEVLQYSLESVDALVERGVKAVVIACNTSTAVALTEMRRRYDLPVLGVIRPGASSASLATRNRRVGVIGTPATIRSHAYFGAIKDENPAVEVYEHATP